MSDEDEVRNCDACGAVCDMRIGYCECGPGCPYPPYQGPCPCPHPEGFVATALGNSAYCSRCGEVFEVRL